MKFNFEVQTKPRPLVFSYRLTLDQGSTKLDYFLGEVIIFVVGCVTIYGHEICIISQQDPFIQLCSMTIFNKKVNKVRRK
jgi:hypothetical protein